MASTRILTAFAIIMTVLMIVARFMEKDITGSYKIAKIYGPVYAYFAVNSLLGSVLGIFSMILTWSTYRPSQRVGYLIAGILLIGLGVFLYYRVYKKSPDFVKYRCLRDLTISGLASSCRVGFFFLRLFFRFWFTVMIPDTYVVESTGQRVSVWLDSTIYDPSTGRYGKLVNGDTVQWELM